MSEIIEVIAKYEKQWENVNPLTSITKTLFQKYKKVLVTIQNGLDTNQYYLADFINSNNSTDTLKVFIENYSLTLPTPVGESIKKLDYKKIVKYLSIWDYGFNAKSFNSELYVDNPYIGYTPDIELTLSETSPLSISNLENNLLFLINGLVTVGEFRENSIILKNGQLTLDKYHSQRISVLDFTQLNGFTVLNFNSLTTEIVRTNTVESLIKLTSDNDVFNNVTPLLLMNGRIRLLTKDYSVNSKREITINFNHEKLLKECVGYKASDLKWIEPANLNGDGFRFETIDIEKYLENNLCYIILINDNDVSISKKPLIPIFPNTYKVVEEPTGVLFLEDGIIGDYILTGRTFYGIELTATIPLLKKSILDIVDLSKTPDINLSNYRFINDENIAQLVDIYTL